MMFFMVLIPIVLLLGLVPIVIFTKNMKRTRLKKSFHRNIIVGYLVLLLLGVFVAEFMERKVELHIPPKVTDKNIEFDLQSAIVEGATIPEHLVLAKRSHEVKDELSISPFTGAYMLIERTPHHSNVVSETVYTPELLANIGDGDGDDVYYDFTDQLKIALPVWENNWMTVPKQPRNTIQYTFYHDSNILNQFTGEKTHGYSSGSVSATMMIHLVIPESIELNLPEIESERGTYIEFLE
ncbi:hypothetical protein CSV63_05850 [Sporosarcina sp. P34]|uniref:hypothetical protein n=1 Tax=Sporosarcina sp. P34 TaxID=2048247 RepID=UPI000C166F50|nr:hypothetical protein [Sporosarcina sp. P34]PID16159.1 hypothetical protein CSV63_05850 [Sporosarcina sp. P34]